MSFKKIFTMVYEELEEHIWNYWLSAPWPKKLVQGVIKNKFKNIFLKIIRIEIIFNCIRRNLKNLVRTRTTFKLYRN